MKYVDSKVWLCVYGGVQGWDVDEINKRIDEFNALPFKNEVCFWDWLSYVEDMEYYGFSGLWGSKLMSQVHIIHS